MGRDRTEIALTVALILVTALQAIATVCLIWQTLGGWGSHRWQKHLPPMVFEVLSLRRAEGLRLGDLKYTPVANFM